MSFEFNEGERGPAMISRQDGRFVLDVLGDGRVFVYRLRSGDILARDIQVGGNVVHVVDRVIVPQSMEDRLLFPQAHRESEVEQSAAGAESRFNARLLLAELVRQADTLGDEAVIPLYEFGLRIADARAADDRLELPTLTNWKGSDEFCRRTGRSERRPRTRSDSTT